MPVPDSFHDDNQALETILSNQGATQWRLPRLKADKNVMEEWLAKLQDWLASHFKLPKSNFDFPLTFDQFQKVLYGLVIVLFIVLLYWFIRQIWLSRGMTLVEPVGGDHLGNVENLEEAYVTAIKHALANHQLGLAARLRWKLFLLRQGAGSSLTPLEFFHGRFPETFPSLACYQLMFRETSAEGQTFETMDGALRDLETSKTP